jgi:hypothetical protein
MNYTNRLFIVGDYTGIIFYTFLFILMVYHYNEASLLKEKFSDVCVDEDNKIRELKPSEKPKPKSKPKSKPKPKPKDPKEVFYIYSKFNYLEAQEICKTYKGSLATLSQLEDAYAKGANWCKWGWLNDGTIGYPVQEKYWVDMEGRHKGHCGPTAGINKVRNIDPLQRHGVNCYGIKPKKTKNDEELILSLDDSEESLNAQIQKCKVSKQKAKKQKWVTEQKKDIRILGFNDNKWSDSKPSSSKPSTKTKSKKSKGSWF